LLTSSPFSVTFRRSIEEHNGKMGGKRRDSPLFRKKINKIKKKKNKGNIEN